MGYFKFATRAQDCRGRNRQWSEATGATGIELEDEQEASLQGGDMGAVRICAVALGRHRHVSNRFAGRPLPKIVFQEQGECLFEQDGRSVLLGAGQWCVYDKARPYRIGSLGLSRQTAIVLHEGVGDALAPSGLLQHGSTTLFGTGAALHASMRAALATLDGIEEAEAARWEAVFTGLLPLALREARRQPLPPRRDGCRAKVMRLVERHLSEPTLDVGFLADTLGWSKRKLHQLFSDGDTTLTRIIWDCRLERCRTDLADPSLAHLTITEIALSWGFNDSQHFSRLFKARFGVRPSDARGSASLH